MLSIASAAMLLSGCATVTSKSCPPLVTYPKTFQRAAADELEKLPRESRVATMIVDYSKLRDACRVKPR